MQFFNNLIDKIKGTKTSPKKKSSSSKEDPLLAGGDNYYNNNNPRSDVSPNSVLTEDERLHYQKRLQDHSSDATIFDCVFPLWALTFFLVAAVSFTPLFSSFMAIYVVRKRVDDLVPKNLNVTAVDAAFVFESTFARPIRDSSSTISNTLYNQLQKQEWSRREEAEVVMRGVGVEFARNKFNLPSLTTKQNKFLEKLCNNWRENIQDAKKLDRLRHLKKNKNQNQNQQQSSSASTSSSYYVSDFENKWYSSTRFTQNDLQDLSLCSSSKNNNCTWLNISIEESTQKYLPFGLFQKNHPLANPVSSYTNNYEGSNESRYDPGYPTLPGNHRKHEKEFLEENNDNNNNVQRIEELDDEEDTLRELYSAIDSIVRKSPIGNSFNGNGFVSIWGVNLNESGFVANNDFATINEVESLAPSRFLKLFCGWKYSGLRSTRTTSPVKSSNNNQNNNNKKNMESPFSNFSWMSPPVNWHSSTSIASCSMQCATTYFGLFNASPPRSVRPACDCSANMTEEEKHFYFGASFDSSVTVFRPTKHSQIPSRFDPLIRANPSLKEYFSVFDGGARHIHLPTHIANFSSNYLWVDVAQTVDSFALLENFTAQGLLDRAVSLGARPLFDELEYFYSVGGTSEYGNNAADWVSYNLTFTETLPSMVTEPPQLGRYSTLLNLYATQTTLLDSDMIASNYAAAKIKPPAFEPSSGKTFDCAIPRWWYSFERSPAPCGVEDNFVPDSLTLYRVQPLQLRRQMILQNGLFVESPVRVANVVVGRKIPIGLIEKVFWPIAKQSAFQFSLVDATTLQELACVDATNNNAAGVFAGVTSSVRSAWSNVWNTLSMYVPGQYLEPISGRFPFTSEVLQKDTNTNWEKKIIQEHMDAVTPNSRSGSDSSQQRNSQRNNIDIHQQQHQQHAHLNNDIHSAGHDEHHDSLDYLPENARCVRSTTSTILDTLAGRSTTHRLPLLDADRNVLTSVEDFTTAPRVVLGEAYLFAIPVRLDSEEDDTEPFNPTDAIERSLCENFASDPISDYDFNRIPSRKTQALNTDHNPSSDVACGSDRNTLADQILKRVENSMRVESHPDEVEGIDQDLLKTAQRYTPSPTSPRRKEFLEKKTNKGNLYIFISLQSRDLLELVLKSRSQVVVTSAVCAFIIVIALFIIVRGIAGPLKQLTRVLKFCTELHWVKLVEVNASVIGEVLDLQFSMSYITVKMQSFARFLPPGLHRFGEAAQRNVRIDSKSRRIFSTLEAGGSSSSDDDDPNSSGGGGGTKDFGSSSHDASSGGSGGEQNINGDGGGGEHKLFADAHNDDVEDDLDYENEIAENEQKDLEFSGRSTNYARQLAYSTMGPSGILRARKEAQRLRRQAWRKPSMFHQRRNIYGPDGQPIPIEQSALPVMTAERLGLGSTLDQFSQETPLHSIYVNVTYEGVPIDLWAEESEKVQRRVLSGEYVRDHNIAQRNVWEEKPLLSTKFLLKYRSSDPLVTFVSRSCREVLRERPGETMLLFVETSEGKTQVVHNEDLLFAFEQHASRGTLSPIELTVAKRKPPTSHVLPILFLTVGGTIARIALAFDRMNIDLEQRVRLIGILLIACLTMQIAANTLLFVHILHKMSKADLEFHMWRQVSYKEQRVGFVCALFGVANTEFMGCHKQLFDMKFTAPFTPGLVRQYLRHYTFWSMIFSDFFPLVILWVETVLRQSYDDSAMLFVSLFGIVGLFAVLYRHEMLNVVQDVRPQGDRKPGPFSGRSRGQAQLSRKEATVVRLRLAHADALLSTLDMHHVDTLCEAIYSIVSPLVRSAGGILIRVDGLSFTVIFNAACNTPHHAAAAYSFVSLVNLAIRKHMSPLLAVHARRYWQFRPEDVNNDVLKEFCGRWHRVVAGIVTAEMSVGYSGTASHRTYQHTDWTHQLAGAFMDLSEHYGSEILVNEQCANALQLASEPTGVLARRPALVRHIDIVGLALLESDVMRLMSDSQASDFGKSIRKEKVFEAVIRGLPAHQTWKVPRELSSLFASGFNYPFDDACSALLLAYARVGGAYEAKDTSTSTAKLMEAAAVNSAIAKFDEALAQIFVVQEPRLLQQYCKEFPLDEVANRVYRWARFFGSPNQSEGIVFPRLITGMGTQPHPCELLHGVGSQATHAAAQHKKSAKFHRERVSQALTSPQQQKRGGEQDQDQEEISSGSSNSDDFVGVGVGASSKKRRGDTSFLDAQHEVAVAESRKFFDLAPLVRPPRSERRQAEQSRTEAKVALIDRILDQKQFSLNFVERDPDEPINEL